MKIKVTKARFNMKFLDTTNKSKAYDCKRNLSLTILKGTREIMKLGNSFT